VSADSPPPTKGHWPAGKRRNPDGGQWSRIRLSLTSLVTEYYEPGVRTCIQVGLEIGVSDRSVRRWIKGEDVPALELQDLLKAWCAGQVAAIKAERAKAKAARARQ